MTFLFKIPCCIVLVLYASLSIGSELKDTLQNSSCGADHPSIFNDVACHLLKQKQWAFSYIFSNFSMAENRVGSTKISDEKLFESYIMAPDRMTMNMHMLMLMYGINKQLTLMAMVQYLSNSMTMRMSQSMSAVSSSSHMNMGGSMDMEASAQNASNFGDSRLTAMYSLLERNRHRIMVNAGLSIPSGSITEVGTTMLGANNQLPYNMQTGTGTFGLLPSATYMHQRKALSFGINAGSNIKLGTNSQGYAFGNTYFASAAVGYNWFNWLNNSMRLENVYMDHIRGYDKDVAILMNNDPNSNSLHYGGKWLNIYFGIDLFTKLKSKNDNRFHIEYGIPVSQNINGPQLSLQSTLSIGWYHTIN